jgi:hypothetical protein
MALKVTLAQANLRDDDGTCDAAIIFVAWVVQCARLDARALPLHASSLVHIRSITQGPNDESEKEVGWRCIC